MATGSAWHLEDPTRPWALMDPDANLAYPVDISSWLEGLGDTYSAHEVDAEAPLQVVSAAHSAGVLTVRIKAQAGAAYVPGQLYPFTIRLTCSGGQIDDRTLWLKLQER